MTYRLYIKHCQKINYFKACIKFHIIAEKRYHFAA